MSRPTPIDIPTFASTQLNLLSHELDAEVTHTAELIFGAAPATLQRAGIALLNLQIASQRTGLGGKTVLELELDPAIGKSELPEHGLRVGDIVGVRSQVGGSAKKQEKALAEKDGVDGVMVKVSSTSLAIALDKEEVDPPGGKLWMCVVE
jgi:DNA polymerase alpha-associated DNA helicase A